VGDRAGEGRAYGNLGNAYDSQGDYAKAVEYHAQSLAIAKEVGDQAGEGRAYGNLGNSYEAAKWLQAAFDGGRPIANLTWRTSPFILIYAGQEDAALAHLKEHLSWRVQRGRDTCAGCGQTRGEDTPMLTCSGCRVARFCSAYHQKMATKKAALGGSLTTGRHKDICGVLSKWREVVKDGVSPDSCTADLVAFLQR
jgi:hypothetical protein